MKILSLSILLILGLMPLSSCNRNESTEPPASKSGTLIVKMVDTPGNYDQVNIVVDSVQVHISSSDSINGWITMNRVQATYDLLKLVNGNDTVIGKSQLPVGEYSQIRLFIGDGSNVVIDAVTYPLTIPSGSQSGLKLNVHATIQADVIYTITLDFDANRSIIKTGDGNYKLKPVIRVITTGITGLIVGVVSPPISHSEVWGFSTNDTISTFTDTLGQFKLLYLPPAIYSVKILPSSTLYEDTILTNVAVIANQTVNLDTINLQLK